MVENQQSINTVLSFGAKSVNPIILEKLLIGREKTADYMFDSVKAIAEYKNNQQLLVIGQRGMGKTHLLRILYYRIRHYISENKIVVAYFSEEEYGVANYFDFLIRILNALIKWNDSNRDYLLEKIADLQETQPKAQEFAAEKIIEDYLGEKPLLILAENFADILESISVKEQGKLRAWLYKVNRVSIIATSQAISDDFDREDRPFYGFFNVYYLKNLSYIESLQFLISLAEIDKREDVVEFLQHKGQAQVKALYQLVKGNHRLLVTFYEFLKSDTIAKLSTHFIKTINDLKPYYETFIRYLPAQQQKILRYIALSRKPQQGTNISKNCFINQKSVSKELSELTRKGLIEAIIDPKDKRNKLYDINEPLLRISIEVGEHKEGITALFIDFLAIYFNESELAERKNKFSQRFAVCEDLHDKMQYSYEIQAIERALELKNTEYFYLEKEAEKELVSTYISEEDYDGLFLYLTQEEIINSKEEFYGLIAYFYFTQKNFKKSIEFYHLLIEHSPNDASSYNDYGIALKNLAELNKDDELFKESIRNFNKAILLNPDFDTAFLNLGNVLLSKARLNKDEVVYLESIENYNKSIKLNPNDDFAYYNLGVAFLYLAYLKEDQLLFQSSINNFRKSVEINPNDDSSYYNLGLALVNLAQLKNDENLILEAIENFTKAIGINHLNNAAYFYLGYALFFLAKFNKNKKLFLKSIENYKKSIEINPNYDDAYNYLFIALNGLMELSNSRYNSAELLKILELIISTNNTNQINNCLIAILAFSDKLEPEKIEYLRSVSKNYRNQIPELEITGNYIDIYQRYVLGKDTKAIYDLPKEQRNFFEDNILHNKE